VIVSIIMLGLKAAESFL